MSRAKLNNTDDETTSESKDYTPANLQVLPPLEESFSQMNPESATEVKSVPNTLAPVSLNDQQLQQIKQQVTEIVKNEIKDLKDQITQSEEADKSARDADFAQQHTATLEYIASSISTKASEYIQDLANKMQQQQTLAIDRIVNGLMQQGSETISNATCNILINATTLITQAIADIHAREIQMTIEKNIVIAEITADKQEVKAQQHTDTISKINAAGEIGIPGIITSTITNMGHTSYQNLDFYQAIYSDVISKLNEWQTESIKIAINSRSSLLGKQQAAISGYPFNDILQAQEEIYKRSLSNIFEYGKHFIKLLDVTPNKTTINS